MNDLFAHPRAFQLASSITLGRAPFVLIAGPCAVESQALCLEVAQYCKELCTQLNVPYVFKASFDKANRTSSQSFRGLGFAQALEILADVRQIIDVPLLTDVHEVSQVGPVSQVVDVLQIPAFLCRQTDLLRVCGETGRPVNIKKGQFMAPEDMRFALDKVYETGNQSACLTERGTTFGYHNLVVDMRGLAVMRGFSPVIFDVTHSVQMPGGQGGASGGQREFAPLLARAAAAAGVDGFFIETHPNPSSALSDGPNMIPLNELEELLRTLAAVSDAARNHPSS